MSFNPLKFASLSGSWDAVADSDMHRVSAQLWLETYFINSSRLELTSSLDRSSPDQGSTNLTEPIPWTKCGHGIYEQSDDPSSWCLLYLWFFDNFSCKCFCSYRNIFTEINCYTAIVICAAVTRDPRTATGRTTDRSARRIFQSWFCPVYGPLPRTSRLWGVDPWLLLFSAEWFSLNPDLRLLNAEISVIKK